MKGKGEGSLRLGMQSTVGCSLSTGGVVVMNDYYRPKIMLRCSY